jgi:hypothetical protein
LRLFYFDGREDERREDERKENSTKVTRRKERKQSKQRGKCAVKAHAHRA